MEPYDEFVEKRIKSDFSYHKVTPEIQKQMAALRVQFKELAQQVRCLMGDQGTGSHREMENALAKLEEAHFWSNAGLARSCPTE